MTKLHLPTLFALSLLGSCIHHEDGTSRSRSRRTDRATVDVARDDHRRDRDDTDRDRDRDRDRDPDRDADRDDPVTRRTASRSLTDAERTGIEWIVAHQLPSGGWGQGDEAPAMGSPGEMRDAANVADTCMATLALIRSGNTPASGRHREVARRGVEYVLASVERSDDASLSVTDVQGTRVQAKIGTFVDTFASVLLMTEAKGLMASATENRRLERALDRVVRKIERNQNPDGTWANQGWAPTLSQGMASLGLNRASQTGSEVPAELLARVEEQARGQFDARTGNFAAGAGSAGVEIYAGAAASSGLRASAETRRQNVRVLERQARSDDSNVRARARRELDRGRRVAADADEAEAGLVGRLSDQGFVSGFGSNGGEEFLSYMLISETLAAGRSERFDEWNGRMKTLLAGVQNNDGSWAGHHCITGRTFCTSTALLVLLADQGARTTSLRELRG